MPIIILSAYDSTAVEQEARSVGVDAFIAKPLFKSRLVHVMKGLLASDEEEGEPASEYEVLQAERLQRAPRAADRGQLHRRRHRPGHHGHDGAWRSITPSNGLHCRGEAARRRAGPLRPGGSLDIQMPVMNGYEAAKRHPRRPPRARASDGDGHRRRVPIWARFPSWRQTADAFADDVARARAAGMNAHMSKPMEIELLVKTLKEWL